jgi:UDP:flavonoid glycosyltransferase YjiC (YdhE family)
LVYLRGSAAPEAVLTALASHGAQVICAWPDAKAFDVELAARRGQVVVAGPISLNRALQEADWVVNYGSSGFVCQSLLAGKPQLMLPSDTEKYLVARTVQSIDAGVVIRVPPTHSEVNFQRTVEEALTRLPRARAPAQQVAQRYAAISWRDQLMAAVCSLVEMHEPLASSIHSHPNTVDAGQST